MSYKKVDKIFENWRKSTNTLPPISNHFKDKEKLNENYRDKLFQLMAGASLIFGTAIGIDYLKDLERKSKERIEQRDKVDLDKMETAEKYHYLLKKDVEAEIAKNPELAKKFTDPNSEMFSVFKKGKYKGQLDRVSIMQKYLKKYKDDLNITDNGNYVYIEPGAIPPDEVLPMLGITADQYRKLLSADKNFMELTRVAMGNPQSWTYGQDVSRQFARTQYEGENKPVLPLDWSISMEMASAKGQQFMEEVAEQAYFYDSDLKIKRLNPKKFNEIKKKYGIHNKSDYQKSMWALNDFMKTETHSVWDQIEDFAGVDRTHRNYHPEGLRGYEVRSDELPAKSSLKPNDKHNLRNVNKFDKGKGFTPEPIKESIKHGRKVCIKISKS